MTTESQQHVLALREMMNLQHKRLAAAKVRKQVELHVDIDTFDVLVRIADAAVVALELRHGVKP